LENLADFPVATPHSEAVHIMECLRAITTQTVWREIRGALHTSLRDWLNSTVSPALFRQYSQDVASAVYKYN
jgi:hypothetical protein